MMSIDKLSSVGCPLCSGIEQDSCMSDTGRTLKKCLRCGVYFLEPLPRDAEISSFFSKNYITDTSPLEAFARSRDHIFRRIALAIQKIKRSGRILDIGCADGYFLDRFFPETKSERWVRSCHVLRPPEHPKNKFTFTSETCNRRITALTSSML
jgi:hypothetical protein